MKRIKKLICALTAVGILAVSAIPVFAAGINANEKEVLDVLRAGATVGGKHYQIESQYINQAENWLNTSYDMTADEATQVKGYIEEVKTAVIADGATELAKLSSATKSLILSKAQAAAAVVGLKVSITGGTSIVVTDAQGNVVFKGDDVIKVTGGQADATNAIVLSFAIVAVIAAAGVGVYKLRATEA